jgi:hypothetical protein
MAFLDFIRNRGGQQAAVETQAPQAETAKQMYTRQAGDEQTATKPSELVHQNQRTRLAEAQALYDKGTQEPPTPTHPPSPAPAGAANPQPMQQQGIAEDRTAPEMSPTSGLASSRAQDVDGPSAPAPAKSQQQTVARPAPSWER